MLLESVLLDTLIQTTCDTIIHEFSKQKFHALVSGTKTNNHVVFNIAVPSIEFSYILHVPLQKPLNRWIELFCRAKKRNYSLQLDLVSLRQLIHTLS